MTYYYLMASLPHLLFGAPPPLSLDDFVFQCSGILEEHDLEELKQVLDFNVEACRTTFAKDYLRIERGLRFGISGIRAGRLGLDTARNKEYELGYDTFVDRAIIDGFAKTDPRERAWTFDQTRWYLLEELSQFDPFGLSSVLAFGLKIRLMERWFPLQDEPGRLQFENLLSTILTSAVPEAS